MTLRAALLLVLALPGLAALPARAQTGSETGADTGAAPEILLPQAAPESDAAPEAPPEVPVIVLEPGQAAAPSAGEGPARVAPLAVPVTRDTGAAAISPAAPLMIPLLPAGPPLPAGVQVGGSLPEPGILRLTGETVTQEMQLILPEGVAPPQQELVLMMRSSVNVLPETARMTVTLNDAEPVELRLEHLGPFVAVRVPAPGLLPGLNRVALSLYQPHRIYCGPDATFQVWTELDLAASGVAVPARALTTDAPGFVAAMRAQAAGGRAVGLQAGEGLDPAVLRGVARALAAALGGAGRVEARRPYGMQAGDVARVTLIAADRDQITFRRDMAGAIVMVVEVSGAAVPDLAGLLPAADGAAAAPAVAELTPGAPVSFAQLGVPRIIGNTHYFRRDVPFRLPEDWLLLANQRASLTLHYGFADGLAKDALLLVKINGETVRLLPLDRAGGKVQPPLDIPFAANLLHAGRNDVTLEAIVPGDPPDAPCTRRKADMLVVLDDSFLDIPASPKMRQPGLAEPLARLGGDSVIVPDDAPQKARLEFAALPLSTLLDPLPGHEGGARLNIVTLEGAGLVPLAGTGLSLRTVQRAVFRPAEVAPAAAGEPAPEAPAFRLTEEEAPPPAAAAPAEPGWLDRLWLGATRLFTAEGWFARQWGAIRDAAFLDSDGPLEGWLQAHSGTALLLRPDRDDPDSLWLVLGPEADLAGFGPSLDQFRRSGLARGDAALMQPDGSWIVWSSGEAPELLEPLTPGNIRAVLGNYASWSPLVFMLALLGLALLSVLPALAFILLTRRKGAGT